ncbi:MAG: aminotransferase class IV family protein [Phycisphaeraceae bacterium]|nr:aminotransferase class IV family protein [Phycisphaeraceae bacterium]
MRPEVWLNGAFVSATEARVPVFDAGLQHGIGLFETMLAKNGRVFRVDAHLRRLAESASILGLTKSIPMERLRAATVATVERSGLRQARVRLTLTGGSLNLLARERRPPAHFTTMIVAQPAVVFKPEAYEQGVRVQVAEPRLNPTDPMGGHKTVNYWLRLSVLHAAGEAGMDEALWFTTGGRLVGASIGNAFAVIDGVIVTPPVRSETEGHPVLPGITRAAVLEVASIEGIAVDERHLTLAEILAADEIFLTNSTWGVLPVSSVEGQSIGSGRCGPVARAMRSAIMDLIDVETRE